MPTRLLNQANPTLKRIQAPDRKADWMQLLVKTIQRAEGSGDRRLEGLKRALVDSQAERHLRRLGVIHDVDLDREFPRPPV